MARQPAIELHGIGVEYRLEEDRILSFKEFAIRRLLRGVQSRVIRALNNVSLQVQHGEVFGLVGKNGAGKSTLMRVVSRVLHPTSGRLVTRGRVAPLLELGAGFHPDMSGQENVFLNALILGYPRKEVAARLDTIFSFAELDDFRAAPVRTYSSGMQARLGFSVATMFRPDILVLDEVWAVGDVGFREKCFRRIQEFRSQGTTILLATHDATAISDYCDRAALLDHGELVTIGDSNSVLARYQELFSK